MYINYEYYRVFYYAAKCGNLTKAAALLQNSQPNLTRAIKTLEAELGCTLFSRTNRGLILTPEGEALYRHIRVAFAEIEAGEAAVTQSRTLERGSVFLAASEGALRCLLLPVLREFCTRYPGVHLRISNHSTPQAVAALHETTADFAVVTTPAALSPSLTQTRLAANSGGAGLCAGVFRAAGQDGHAGRSGCASAHHARRGNHVARLLCRRVRPARRAVSARDRGGHRPTRSSRWPRQDSASASCRRTSSEPQIVYARLNWTSRCRRVRSASSNARAIRSASPPGSWSGCC